MTEIAEIKRSSIEATTLGTIPDALIYEMWSGKPVYYRGYKEVFDNPQLIEKSMGSSVYQSLVISSLLKYLFKHLPDKYEALTNEVGVLLAKNDWRSADIAICDKAQILALSREEQNKYLHFVPNVVIEIDTKADMGEFSSIMDYYADKTDDLLDFGVERVIGIFTGTKKIMTATKGNPWQIVDWSASVEIIGGLFVSLESDLAL
ncbi:MAG: Uma2 family endonuclease [Candidatus Kapabacteria bacterium]|jgi:hypothetical protein|nr:Uma2 family endonuclease [Candidatus Kapabacteria bacterium]